MENSNGLHITMRHFDLNAPGHTWDNAIEMRTSNENVTEQLEFIIRIYGVLMGWDTNTLEDTIIEWAKNIEEERK